MVTCTVQVTNVSPHASERQMKELFSYFGGIDEIRVYPEDDSLYSVPSKVCFVTFKERSSLETALHLTNTVFIDRALIVAQSRYEVIPDEDTALSLAAPAVASVGGSSSGGNALIPTAAPLLPTPAGVPSQQPSLLGAPSNALLQTPLSNALQQVQAAASSIAAAVQAPVLTVAGSVIPQAAPITGNVDPTKIDEIRRTVYVGNLNTHLTADQVMHFFQPCGEIRYVRMAGDETQPTRFAFVEFTNPESVPIALQYNGALFGDRPVKVNHSKNAIVKPQGKTPELAQREVDEAMQKVREATMAISTAIEPPVSKRRSKFRSRTPSPNSSHRSRRSPGRRRSRSRSPGRRRSRSRSPRGRRRSSRSPRRRKSRSKSPRRRKSYSRSPTRYKKRSSSRSPRRREYYRGGYNSSSRHSGSSSHYRHRSRTPDRDRNRRRRRSYSRSRSRSPKRSSSSRKSQKSYDDRDYRRRDRDRSPSPSEHKKSHKKKSKKEKRHKRSRSPTPRDSLSPEQSDIDSGHEEEEVCSRQSSDAEMAEETHDKDTSRSESDKATSEDDD